MSILSIDIGSTDCKCAVFSDDGEILDLYIKEHPKGAGESRLDAQILWESLAAMLRTASQRHGTGIKAVGTASFGESFTIVDREGEALTPFILSSDDLGHEHIQALTVEEREQIAETTGLQPDTRYSLSKLLAQAKQDPALLAPGNNLLMVCDYICFRLTGERKTVQSIATRTLLYNIWENRFDRELLRRFSIPERLFCPVLQSGAVVGKITPAVAALTGLPVGIPVINAGHDAIPEAVGSGLLGEDCAAIGTGTTEGVSMLCDSGALDRQTALERNIVFEPYVLPGKYLLFGFHSCAGRLVTWYRDIMRRAGVELLGADPSFVGYEQLDAAASETPTGLLFIPHLAGSCTPDFRRRSRAVMAGLHLGTTAGEIYRGLLEGTAYELCYILECLEEAAGSKWALYVSGGGAKSALWLQIKADILGRELIPLAADTTLCGTAMIAAVSAGILDGYTSAAKVFIRTGEAIQVDSAAHKVYSDLFEQYKALRALMAEYWG